MPEFLTNIRLKASQLGEQSAKKVKPKTPQDVPVDIDSPSSPFLTAVAAKTFFPEARQKMYERLASPIEAGVPVKTAISQLYQRAFFKSATETQAVVLRNVLFSLNSGGQISEGLRKFIPLNELLLIRAGEEKGDLSGALFRAAHTIESQAKVRAAIKSAIVKPLFLFTMLIVAMYVVGAHVAPKMSSILPMEEWRGQARFLGVLSSLVLSPWFYISLGLLAGLIVLILMSQKRWKGRGRAFADRLPPYNLYRVMQGSGWLTTYSAMLQSGRRVESILSELYILSERDNNQYLADRTRKIMQENAYGAENIGIAMERAGTSFPDNELIADMVMQASLKNFDERIGILADRWINNAVKRVEAISANINGVATILLAVFMGFFVTGVITLNQQIASSMGAL